MSEEDAEAFDYYVINDGLGISHVMRRPKGAHPSVRCVGCD